MATYDETIIHREASRLYARASAIVWQCTLRNAVAGSVLSLAAWYAIVKWTGRWDVGHRTLWLVGTIGVGLGGYYGYGLGQQLATALRLQAQQLLLLTQIERNTRHT